MNTNTTNEIDLNRVISIVMVKTKNYYNIVSTEEEDNKLIDELLSDEYFIDAVKNIVKVTEVKKTII